MKMPATVWDILPCGCCRFAVETVDIFIFLLTIGFVSDIIKHVRYDKYFANIIKLIGEKQKGESYEKK